MTYPHVETPPARRPPPEPICGCCGHYPIWHAQGWRRILPWLSATFCLAWNPDKPGFTCDCKGWA